MLTERRFLNCQRLRWDIHSLVSLTPVKRSLVTLTPVREFIKRKVEFSELSVGVRYVVQGELMSRLTFYLEQADLPLEQAGLPLEQPADRPLEQRRPLWSCDTDEGDPISADFPSERDSGYAA